MRSPTPLAAECNRTSARFVKQVERSSGQIRRGNPSPGRPIRYLAIPTSRRRGGAAEYLTVRGRREQLSAGLGPVSMWQLKPIESIKGPQHVIIELCRGQVKVPVTLVAQIGRRG